MCGKKEQESYRAKWKSTRPEEYEECEARRLAYLSGRAAAKSVAQCVRPVYSCYPVSRVGEAGSLERPSPVSSVVYDVVREPRVEFPCVASQKTATADHLCEKAFGGKCPSATAPPQPTGPVVDARQAQEGCDRRNQYSNGDSDSATQVESGGRGNADGDAVHAQGGDTNCARLPPQQQTAALVPMDALEESSTTKAVYSAKMGAKDFERQARRELLSGGFNLLFLELCCEPDSVLSAEAPEGVLALRVTLGEDLASKETRGAIHRIIRHGDRLGMRIVVWASTPCTTGCPWQYVNRAAGASTGDADLADILVRASIAVCRHVLRVQGYAFWEWPPTNGLWQRPDVKELVVRLGDRYVDISSAALGQRFIGKQSDGPKAIRKKWRVYTNALQFIDDMKLYSIVPALPEKDFVMCRGKVAKQSGQYPRKLATLLWKALQLSPPRDPLHVPTPVAAGPPIWSCLMTRKVNVKSAEAKCDAAIKAFHKEVAGHRARGTWNEAAVREHRDLICDPQVPEFMLGRVFGILGVKNAEDPSAAEYKYRSVFQGSNVRTKTGIDAIDLYQEVSSSPVSFAAVRAVLAVACLLGLDVTVCDALQAYLQARIDQEGRVPTFVELPVEMWPDEWFQGGDRAKPLFRRPVCPLCRALYGHPEAGALWEALFTSILGNLGWKPVASWPGVFSHGDGSIICVYVDDILLAAHRSRSDVHWASLFAAVEFKDDPAPVSKFLGAHYQLDCFDPACPNRPRAVGISMSGYTTAMADKFERDTGANIDKPADTPYLSDQVWASAVEEPGRYRDIAPSHAASALFLSRVGRPDISAMVQRLCSKVAAWTTTHDRGLIRLMQYCRSSAGLSLTGSLSTDDLQCVEIVCYSDADLNGNPETSKSVTGVWLELVAVSGRSFPLSWCCSTQTSTASATAEAETVAFSHAWRREALPMQMLLETLLQQHVHIKCMIDNTQTIQAVEKGYSKKLRHLPRTQRVCIGALHEAVTDKELRTRLVHCPTLEQKADIFTKSLDAAKFGAAVSMLGMKRIGGP